MEVPIKTVDPLSIFPQLAEIPQPPKQLFVRGTLENLENKKIVVVVGSRRCSSYGAQACRTIIEGLRGYPIVVVSGLALGMDSIAHQTACDTGITTLAFPGSGLGWNSIYPARHRALAETIIEKGGALISEYPEDYRAALWTFPRRNRLLAGIADMVIVVEAEEKSGTLITARLAIEYNKVLGVVPGTINSPLSRGAHQFLKLGAVPITESADIVRELGLQEQEKLSDETLFNSDERRVLEALTEPKTRDDLGRLLALDATTLAITLSTLEIKGAIVELLGKIMRTPN